MYSILVLKEILQAVSALQPFVAAHTKGSVIGIFVADEEFGAELFAQFEK